VNVLETLSDEQRAEFERLQENGSPEEMEEFLRGNIDNYDDMVTQTVQDFKKEVKETIEKL
ncbi:hypothetical protein GWO43_14210, partial [candidate division KSB1 bacterium]|nr:hypothetical protein [candidate division KSB1 bacterium]NIV70489.1 hypothetical protein [Phycisphaerae bacterium]NIS25078.1 hypothetical protein [candidate division KSB1 bacterium]NIT71997.1 hypothetical protein [candidate division KSB1 bacterium]NIU25120.1 hypothetical protein [candidate division KSB1 bacterium]